MSSSVYVVMRSFDRSALKSSADKMLRSSSRYPVLCTSFPLPRKRRSFTVNRSPHVNKKSREQFVLFEYKRCVMISSKSSTDAGGVGSLKALLESDAFSNASPLVDLEIKKR